MVGYPEVEISLTDKFWIARHSDAILRGVDDGFKTDGFKTCQLRRLAVSFQVSGRSNRKSRQWFAGGRGPHDQVGVKSLVESCELRLLNHL